MPCNRICGLYPSWTETDQWGRSVQWSTRDGKYYRRLAVSFPLRGDPSDDREVSATVFGLALLRAHESR